MAFTGLRGGLKAGIEEDDDDDDDAAEECAEALPRDFFTAEGGADEEDVRAAPTPRWRDAGDEDAEVEPFVLKGLFRVLIFLKEGMATKGWKGNECKEKKTKSRDGYGTTG